MSKHGQRSAPRQQLAADPEPQDLRIPPDPDEDLATYVDRVKSTDLHSGHPEDVVPNIPWILTPPTEALE